MKHMSERKFLSWVVFLLLIGIGVILLAVRVGAASPEQEFLNRINAERATPLHISNPLSAYATAHSQEMAGNENLYHSSSTELRNATTGWVKLGENVGRGGTPASLMRAFMASDSHRRNMLNEDYTHVGIGVAYSKGLLYVTTVFAAYQEQTYQLFNVGVIEDWSNEMNQETYWEARFGAQCTKYKNHNGYVPAQYDIAITKAGQYVAIYNPAPDNDFVEGPYGKDISWIMKCKTVEQPTTTTTVPPSTTTTTEETTTTTVPSTTTTTPEASSSTTTVPSTTTSSPPASTSTSTSLTPPTPEPPDDGPPELPYTGVGTTVLSILGGSLLAGGLVALARARGVTE